MAVKGIHVDAEDNKEEEKKKKKQKIEDDKDDINIAALIPKNADAKSREFVVVASPLTD